MNKKIRLTENELVEIVGRVISETERKLKRGSTNKVLRRHEDTVYDKLVQRQTELYYRCKDLAHELDRYVKYYYSLERDNYETTHNDMEDMYEIISEIKKLIWLIKSEKPKPPGLDLEYIQNICIVIIESYPDYDDRDIQVLLHECEDLISYILD